MTYRQDPARQARAKWHALLNNGQQYAAIDRRGNIIAHGMRPNSHALKVACGVDPALQVVRVADQI
jgi:hypothetical protein